MNRSKRDFMIVSILCMMLLTTTAPVLGGDDVRGDPWIIPTDFHNAYVHVNLTYENGTPAEGFTVQFMNKNSYSMTSRTTNSTGEVDMTIFGYDWGIGTIRIREGAYWQGYEEFFIGPDQTVYLDMVVDEIPADVNTITGTLRNMTSGEVVANTEVIIRGNDVYNNVYFRSDTSDAQGIFEIKFPNSTRPFNLAVEFSTGEEFFPYSESIQMYDPPEVIDQDIELLPTYMDGSMFRLKVYNSTTDQVLPGGRVDINGYFSTFDFDRKPINDIPRNGDWYHQELPTGEYEFSWRADKDPYWNVTFGASGYFLMNDTPMDLEMGVIVPGFVDLNVEVWNSTNPLNSAYISYTHTIMTAQGKSRFDCHSSTNINGKVHAGIPVGMQTVVHIYKSGYTDHYFTLDPTRLATIERNITLEKAILDVPLADVTIVVKDRETGVPLPGASISGNGYFGNTSVSLGWGKTTNGTGVFAGQIYQGDYSYFYVNHNIGRGKLDKITIDASNPEIVILVDRFEAFGEMLEYNIAIKDPDMTPVPDIWVTVASLEGYPGSRSVDLRSDASGVVRFYAYPRTMYEIYIDDDSPIGYRSMWASGSIHLTTPETGGGLDDMIVYSSSDLNSLQGFVRDSTDRKVLAQADIHFSSFAPGVDPMFNPFVSEYWGDVVYLFGHNNAGSDENGYYRVRGKDLMFVFARANGYLPLIYRPDMITRADLQHDLILDPIPEETFTISGSVIDQDGDPADYGWVGMTDQDRGGAPLDEWADLSDGNQFSFDVWKGNFTINFENQTIKEYLSLEVTSDQEGIIFQVMPEFNIGGTVTDWEGTPVEGLNVSLILHDDTETEIAWTMTDGEGHYIFQDLNKGDYTVSIGLTESFDNFETETIFASGWEDINVPIVLSNRSIADVAGTIMGEEGPYVEGIPMCHVSLYKDGVLQHNMDSGESGNYLFKNVSHGGNYSIEVAPPLELQPVENVRSGYLENTTYNITVSRYEVVTDIYLPYKIETPLGYMNITSYWPKGDDVPLDDMIVLEFSMPVNVTTIDHQIEFTPSCGNMTYSWSEDKKTLTLEHDDMQPNTTYMVMFPSTALSMDGYPLHPGSILTWNFTTGSSVALWRLTDAVVDFQVNHDISVSALGKASISVYFVVEDVGSFLLEEAGDGVYELTIPMSEFDWNTTYSYHFSSIDGGPDEAPAFSATFTTPVNPAIPPGWDISEASVAVDEDGDWTVSVIGETGMTIFIVIDDVGSFLLEETEDGLYELTISGDEFEWGEDYPYHFSDSSGGDDLAPSVSGTQTIPQEPEGMDDDEDNWTQKATICCLSILILLLLIILIIVFVVRRKKKADPDEE
ncbi:MAG: carboxypeptidase regulatory-like domain-containing protein [Candidatus Thermoplasmatota archaeon]|nr:carboxypeptidase regulatory-like domain-containing protein [Candidatus Thermoplasmatota archaeon]